MNRTIRIGTRESELAVWQATAVQKLLQNQNINAELVFVKSEGDIDLVTPLYEMGMQGIFTKTLDIALLNERIDIAVHSMKDVPTLMPPGISKAAVLKRASYKDLLVYKRSDIIDLWQLNKDIKTPVFEEGIIATSSIRRKAQWLHRYPKHRIENLRGNVNTRMFKVSDSHWDGAIFAAAGLDRIDLRPKNSIELDWMLPAPAQGAIMVVCRSEDMLVLNSCKPFNDSFTDLCTKIERDFLHELKGGCSTPVSALAEIKIDQVIFKAGVCSIDGADFSEINKIKSLNDTDISELGISSARELLQNEKACRIIRDIRNER